MRFSPAIPFFVLLLSCNLLIFNEDFYKQEMPNYESYADTVDNLLHFFKGGKLETGHFSEQEIIHLYDVRRLILFSLILLGISGIYITLSIATEKKESLKKELIRGGIYSLALTGIFALTLLSFSTTFIQFHELLFSNNYWLLPADATLIHMFPEEFFLESTKQIILYSIIFSLFCITLGTKIEGQKNDKRT